MRSNESNDYISFKRVDQNQLNDITRRVNNVIMYIQTNTITQTNNLIKAASVFVARELGLKKGIKKKMNEPWWKRRIEADIKRIRHDVNILEREKKGHLKRRAKFEVLEEKYNIKRKGLSVVIEELKQRQLAKLAKINRYEQRIKQYRQNRLFQIDQKKLYQELNGEVRAENVIPNAEESKKFWSDIWGVKKEHNRNAEWLQNIKTERNYNRQPEVVITKDMVAAQCKKMPN